MNAFQLNGEIINLNENQLKFITASLKERGFENGTLKIESVGKVDDNYGSSIKRFTVQRDGSTLKMIAKIAPSNVQMRKIMHSETTFKNEGVMFSKVLPKFAELEIKAGIPEGERLRFAECYGVFTEEPHEIILMEDLKESNFCILDKFQPFSDGTVRLVLKNFVKLHSMSLVLKHEDLNMYKSFTDELVNPWKNANEQAEMNAFFCSLEEEVLKDFVYSEKHKKIVKGSLSRITKNYVTISKDHDNFSVIQHGDAWTNNLMFTLENNRTIECCMIDYQNSNEFNPAADILYMILNCTDYKTRSIYYQSWIHYYYKNLDDRLRKFGLDTNDVYPREILDKYLKRLGKLATGQAIMAASIVVRETHEAVDMKDAMKDSKTDDGTEKSKLKNLGKSSLKRFKEKLDGLIKSYEEIGFDDYDDCGYNSLYTS